MPVPGATVAVSGSSASTNTSGRYSLTVPTGHSLVTVTAAGYVPYRRDYTFGITNLQNTIYLIPRASIATIGATATTVTAGDVQLMVPADTFPTNTSISVTPITRVNAAIGFGRPLFSTTDNRAHHVVYGVSVDVSTQPAKPVQLQLPVPAIGSHTVTLWSLGANGAMSEPIAPTSVSGGLATLLLTHFSEYAIKRMASQRDP